MFIPETVNITVALQNAELDPVAGIRHAVLIAGKDASYHVAQIETSVNAHVHRTGSEFYQIISGVGVMHLGKVRFKNNKPFLVKWKPPFDVKAGDVFDVPAGYAHCLQNTSCDDAPLTFTFYCSNSHLSHDRVLVTPPESV